jgi:hypothetical protein
MFPRRMTDEKERTSDRNKSLIELAAYQVHVNMSRAINYERLYREVQMAKSVLFISSILGPLRLPSKGLFVVPFLEQCRKN